jgi:hypothetical protein
MNWQEVCADPQLIVQIAAVLRRTKEVIDELVGSGIQTIQSSKK